MKLSNLFPVVALAAFAFMPQVHGDLVITGAFDGPLTGGLPKVVELYSDGATDLSTYGVGAANNGGGTDGVENILSGSATDGQFIYLVDGFGTDGTDGDFATYFGAEIPAGALIFDGSFSNGGGASINGDDAIELFFDASGAFAGAEAVTDTFGDINTDGSGEAWDYLDGWAYRNDNTGPDGATFNISNWTFSGINVNDGSTDNGTATTPFPIGTYSVAAIPEPGSIAVLGLMSLAFVSRRRR